MRLTLLLAFLCCSVFAQSPLNIPTSHPRLWWTPERLQTARTWYASHPFTPSSTDPAGQAFRYLMTGEASYARAAINWATTITIDTNGVSSNDARWYGEQAILIYDWCYPQFTALERAAFITRWNAYLTALRAKSWGGLEMPQNNYYWGYFRNELMWGIASANENALASTFLNYALTSRWQGSFVPHANAGGRGGVPQEGSHYGRYLLGYSVVPFVSAALMGRPLYNETDFFRSAVFYAIHATTPGPTNGRYELFPNNDDHDWRGGGSAEQEDITNFMAAAAGQWNGSPIGEYARRWLSQTRSNPARFVQSTLGTGPERSYASLPLDYFASGPQQLFGRNVWGPSSTAFHVQLGNLEGVGHQHNDAGNWQIWRNGEWLSRETVAYGDSLVGYRGLSTVDGTASELHNGILFNGRGQAAEPVNGSPVVRRLESRPAYAYMAADLTPVYRNTAIPYRRVERDNAAVAHIEREYLFIRPLETMVILDRLESTTAGVAKTFIAHFEQNPRIEDGTHVLGINGAQALRLTTLAPQTPVYRVINEDGASIGQYRLEVESSGQTQSYFLHVLQGRDASGQNVNATLAETSTSFTVSLTHPTLGHCRVVFQKGMATNGGGMACSTTSMPSQVQPFTTTVQRMSVGNSGPVWEGATTTPQDTTAPQISGVTAVPVLNAATITWLTNEPSTTQVQYGTTTAYGSTSTLNETLGVTHAATLSNLSQGTLYHYRVLSRDAAGNVATSPNATFTTTSSILRFTITAQAGTNGSISPSGSVLVNSGGSQTFQISPAGGYRIANVLVNGTSVGAVTSYTISNVTANTTISASFTAITTTPPPSPPPSSATTVTMTVHANTTGDGPANLVSNAIPFQRGVLTNAANIRVLDGSVEVPVATRILARWPQDNSIRSLLLQFSAPFTTASKNYTAQIGTARATTDRALTTVTWNLPTRVFTLPASYLSSSQIFGEQAPLGQSGYSSWENKMLNSYSSIQTVGNAPCVRDDQYYDSISTTYQIYARTGNLQYLINARRWALHHRRDQVYLSGENIGHPRCSGAYIDNTRYTFPEGLVNDYFMFGDPEALRVSGLIVDNFYMRHADNFYYQAPGGRGWWTEREPAFAIIGILAHYEATGNATYLTRARERIMRLRQMQIDNGRRAFVHNLYDHDPSEGCRTSDYGSSPWMTGLLLETIVKYHQLTGDAAARESLLMALDDMRGRYLATGSYAGASFVYLGCSAYRDGTPDLDNLIAHAFGYAYKLTGNQTYLNLGRTIFNTAVSSGYVGAHKQYNQQFRSSGHFIAYVTQPVNGGGGGGGGDTTAPTVSITSPTAGQTVSGTITAAANAGDAVGVTGVQFFIDGQSYGAQDTASPFNVAVNTTTLSNGTHTIFARARDAAGNTANSATITFTVNNVVRDTVPPSVGVTSPTNGQRVSGTITATATASDNIAMGTGGVQFLIDGQPYGALDTAPPYAVSINTANLTNATHTIVARARDAAGNIANSAAISFVVSNGSSSGSGSSGGSIPDTTPPGVVIVSPSNGAIVSGNLTVTANATDNVAMGTGGVQFLVDGQASGSLDTAPPYSVIINTRSLANGTHSIAARARDAAGNTATSVPILVVVRN